MINSRCKKNLFFILLTMQWMFGYSQAPFHFHVSGIVDSVENGDLTLQHAVTMQIDTVPIVNHQFYYKGQLSAPAYFSINVIGSYYENNFWIDSTHVQIRIGHKDCSQFIYSGGQENTLKQAYHAQTSRLYTNIYKHAAKSASGDSSAIYKRQFYDSLEALKVKMNDWVTIYNNNYFGIYLVYFFINDDNYMFADSLHNKFTPRIQQSEDWKKLDARIGLHKQRIILPGNKAHPVYVEEKEKQTEVLLSSIAQKPVILNFWATWCKPCIEEMPALLELHKSGMVDIVSISIDTDVPRYQAYIAKHPFEWKSYNISDKANSVFQKYPLYAIPLNVLIDTAGNFVIGSSNLAELKKKMK